MTALLCPLCSKSRFENLDSLRGRLVEAATQNITCPICSEVLLGLDKFTIHLFGHTIQETAPEPSSSTVNMDDLSFLTSWENCWKQNQEEPKPKEAVNELFLEIKAEESFERRKRPSINDTQPMNAIYPKNPQTTMETNLLQQLIDPDSHKQHKQSSRRFEEIRHQNSPKLDSPSFLFEGESSFHITPSPKDEDNDSSQERRNNNEVRELSHYMAGLLCLDNEEQQKKEQLHSLGEREQKMTHFLKQQATILEQKHVLEERINCPSSLRKTDPIIVPVLQSPVRKDDNISLPESNLFSPQFLAFPSHLQPGNIQITGLVKKDHKKIENSKNEEPKLEAHNCKECGKSFRMRGSLVVHSRVAHAGKTLEGSSEPRNYRCSICSKAFKKEQHLSQHIKTHDGKQWQCETCAKFFTTKYFLKKHQRLHTGEMPYCCETCGKTFTFQQSYHKHLLYHSADKPHECRECGRSFKELSTLHNHQRIHSGEKPFACETCGKCFRQRVSYIVHQRIHTGVLPYQCTACLKKFRYKVSQRSHKCTVQPPGIVVRQPGDLIQRLLEQRRLLQCPQ